MVYKEGNGVVVKRSLGRENDQGAGKYYHGASMKEFPLGSRGIVIGVGSGYYKVNFNGNIGYFEERELAIDEKLEKEKQERVNSSLEKALLNSTDESISNPGERSLDPIETEGGRKLPGTLVKILKYFTNPFYNSTPSSSFEPKFNVREEFAVWMDKEFPRSSSGRLIRKRRMSKRKDEVYEAAMKACEHGVNTTDSCIHTRFSTYLDELKYSGKDSEDLYENVEKLLELIKQVSVNVNETDEKHYGTHVRGRR